MGKRWIFDGHIAGLGTSSGLRAVVGVLAPSENVADFIAATYAFDDVALVDVSARLEEDSLRVDAGPLAVSAPSSAGTAPTPANWRLFGLP
ncbi:hypothetical protein [Pseudarthrobacter sp. NamE5]|uniref:hypothetical protein n=1 Tax=Pseudarthrobacter sp. NamE5 TaxID=2576839 RepID=UPI00267CB663